MKKLKVMTILGTRPEIIRLSRVISALDHECDHLVTHTGQNYDYELNGIFFDELNIRQPDCFLNAAGKTATDTIANTISKSAHVLAEEKPDAVLVLGDSNSCLSVISAKRLKIPTFHMEAGNRCFDQRVPEEINRKIIDHTADINLPYSQISRQHLLREGIDSNRIIVTGSPMREVLEHYINTDSKSNILKKLNLTPENYFLVSAHREEHIENPKYFEKLLAMLNMLATKFNMQVILSTHPRTRKQLQQSNDLLNQRIQALNPFGFKDYITLQQNAKAVLSDSGTITEETSILNLRALNIRETHEREEGMEQGAVMMTGMNLERIAQALSILKKQTKDKKRIMPIVQDYQSNQVSEKVLRIIISYTDFVNRTIWKKNIS